MYKIFIENRKRVPYDQIMKLYKGKWVFLVNLEGIELVYNKEADGMEYCDPTSAEILIVADKAYEGSESGIYQELRINPEKYGSISEMDCRVGNRLPANYYVIAEGMSVE